MALILGIDTSNYTTSCALYDTDTGNVTHKKQLLPVKQGECGIRQSDAVFHHTRQLPTLLEEIFSLKNEKIDSVCVSITPRRREGSYMPCFTVGQGFARVIAASHNISLYDTSHQQGHIIAALHSAQKTDLITKPFLAFHVSGGTTEAIIVTPDNNDIISCEIVGKTLDLNAGQLIDRVGVMLGLQFPCGIELENLASEYNEKIKVRPVLKGCDCCLSGFENKLRDLYARTDNKSLTAAYTLAYIEATISGMTERIFEKFSTMPVIYAGGVMSDDIIKNSIRRKFDAYFSAPEFSCDNAAGVAIIGGFKHQKIT